MRLICPNCGAQYAVDERMIPLAGRDVQCSGCGFTWFQVHPDSDPDLMEELAETSPPLPSGSSAATAPRPTSVAPPEPAPVVEPSLSPAGQQQAAVARHPAAAADPLPDLKVVPPTEQEPAPDIAPDPESDRAAEEARRSPDPAAMNVLREEAERERAAREAERAALEAQTDLDLGAPDGLGDADTALAEADAHRAVRTAPRRSLLPDIEEINSTLEPGDHTPRQRRETPVQRLERERLAAGRRIGFGIAVALFLLATLVYLQGPQIGDAVPALSPSLDAYVSTVDTGRIWLDGALRRAAGASDDTALDG